jgi:hypothetical protein
MFSRFMSQYLVSAIHGTREFFVSSSIVIPLAVIEKKRYLGREPGLLSQKQKKDPVSNDRSSQCQNPERVTDS